MSIVYWVNRPAGLKSGQCGAGQCQGRAVERGRGGAAKNGRGRARVEEHIQSGPPQPVHSRWFRPVEYRRPSLVMHLFSCHPPDHALACSKLV